MCGSEFLYNRNHKVLDSVTTLTKISAKVPPSNSNMTNIVKKTTIWLVHKTKKNKTVFFIQS